MCDQFWSSFVPLLLSLLPYSRTEVSCIMDSAKLRFGLSLHLPLSGNSQYCWQHTFNIFNSK